MPYIRRKRSYLRRSIIRSQKYSSETYASNLTFNNNSLDTNFTIKQNLIPVVAGNLGTRKCKNFTLRFATLPTIITNQDDSTSTVPAKLMFALVYVPEGTNANNLSWGDNNASYSLYEPNQNVILSGLIDDNQTYNFKTRLARNLASGDTIGLVIVDLTKPAANQTVSTTVMVEFNYAISF